MKTLKKRRKTKEEIQNKIDQMIDYFLNNEERVISKEELGEKFFGSDDPKTCRIVSSGYLPEVRRELEGKYGRTLLNIRGRGWQVTSGGLDTFKATQQAEKLMIAHKDSYKRKAATFIEDKLPKSIRRLIKARNDVLDNIDTVIQTGIDVTKSIEEAIAENHEEKLNKKERQEGSEKGKEEGHE